MDGDDFGRLAYLALLLLAVGGYFVAQARRNLGRTAQQAAIWVFIFIGVIVAYGLWGDLRRTVLPEQTRVVGDGIEVAASDDGHYYLTAEVNGARVLFVVDTGASQIVLTARDAERAGLDPAGLGYFGSAQTANGMVRTAPVRLERFTLGPFEDRNLPAVVNAGDLDTSLLGMSYLGRFRTLAISGDRLHLTR
ncbi:retropepsin-like aspartic protease family protein [Albidovulum sp.]|uniref:retropepsin-like aspartic protease family protein n=1 Tax=Albidovulum sp. TaxID=1872424 RepID=UPI001D81A48E|nr:TIGR02281 family clan AA aspartic protease [Paracoccaceae bacterium]HPE25793.1 TIGR02281 family clan AA aspartic protease [Albidovulum sp.]MCB2121019.1 TIGR02281 family clan AA aspartic protease [Paracoccaceae bacterium]MCB2133614.1 TIGR02281 family clan AA aspartic protease [Paracoccaceae bacterium]MCB2142743.1 TIGR02281 family clan AA aspartic protease [Paracoccaceae bacterium]